MNALLEKYKRIMAESLAALRVDTTNLFRKTQAKSKLAKVFGLVGSSNPRFCLTLPDVKAPVVRSAARKARKLIMRRAKRVRVDTRGYA